MARGGIVTALAYRAVKAYSAEQVGTIEPVRGEDAAGDVTAQAAVTVYENLFVFTQFAEAGTEFVDGDIDGAFEVRLLVLAARLHVEQRAARSKGRVR